MSKGASKVSGERGRVRGTPSALPEESRTLMLRQLRILCLSAQGPVRTASLSPQTCFPARTPRCTQGGQSPHPDSPGSRLALSSRAAPPACGQRSLPPPASALFPALQAQGGPGSGLRRPRSRGRRAESSRPPQANPVAGPHPCAYEPSRAPTAGLSKPGRPARAAGQNG